MEIGELVRRIVQDIHTDDFLTMPTIDASKCGVVIKTRKSEEWVSGAGPMLFQHALVSWDDGSIGWISSDCLTSYVL